MLRGGKGAWDDYRGRLEERRDFESAFASGIDPRLDVGIDLPSSSIEAPTMRFRRLRSAWPLFATIAAGLSVTLLMTAGARRDERLVVAAYYQQKRAELLNASREEAYIADLAEGKVTSPILAFLNPIGDAESHRAAAAAHADRATRYGQMSSEFEAAAARPWRLVDVSLRSP